VHNPQQFQSPEGAIKRCNSPTRTNTCRTYEFQSPEGAIKRCNSTPLACLPSPAFVSIPRRGNQALQLQIWYGQVADWLLFQSPEGAIKRCNFIVASEIVWAARFQSPEGAIKRCNPGLHLALHPLQRVSIPRRGNQALQHQVLPCGAAKHKSFNPPKGQSSVATRSCARSVEERI